jgi:hypothetical protein
VTFDTKEDEVLKAIQLAKSRSNLSLFKKGRAKTPLEASPSRVYMGLKKRESLSISRCIVN